MKKTHKVVWDALHEIDWQKTLKPLEIAPNIAYDDLMKGFDKIWCGEGLSPLDVILFVTWKVRPRMRIIAWRLGGPWSFPHDNCFSICTKKKKQGTT
jgi:hypothetical protein